MIALDGPALAPAEAARRAAAAPGAFWLCAPAPDEVSIARDLVGAAPARVVRGDDVAALERAWSEERARWGALATGDVPRGVPLAAGWLSYDLGRRWAGLAPRAADGDAIVAPYAPLEFHFHDAVWVRDVGGAATIFARDASAALRLRAQLESPAPPAPPTAPGPLTPDAAADVYLAGARRVLEYLRAGDAYQVNLARRVSAPFAGAPVELAAALRARAPAPFAAFLGAADGGAALVGNSPERFLALDGRGAVETRPIKGTRARGAGLRSGREELLASAKDRAEHVMIVDLERNDLGRVCETGSVVVEGVGRVLDLPTVHHLVSTVRGRLRADVGLAALLEATFPGGSITGAPKRRAMQIIDALEPCARGPYTGATGWLGVAGDLDLAVAIRTALVSGGRLSLSLGGGIVIDSTPEDEWAETEVKARAFARLCE
ncbi:MAG TPA: anthranilate synthase component I family protein [Polyangia bacterium]|nr:anthranilate synthase component I family protein [Polyangia bacterium]